MSDITSQQDSWLKSITKAFEAEVDKLIAQEIEETKQRVEKELTKRRNEIVLSVMSYFECRMDRTRFVIEVKDKRGE